jgi:hypothetical protein
MEGVREGNDNVPGDKVTLCKQRERSQQRNWLGLEWKKSAHEEKK